jgi:protein-tyrosine phosphatase
MGNICRSPTAEGVLRRKLADAGLADRVEVDSAGTHDYHVGAPPDHRSQRHAAQRGYDLSALRARHLQPQDFQRFDLLLVMDENNLAHIEADCPAPYRDRVRLLMDFAPHAGSAVVPDPYYGGPADFERVLDLVEQACDGLVSHLREQLELR